MRKATAALRLRECIGASLRQARRSAGLTQAQLSVLVPLDQGTISRNEAGKYNALTPELLLRLCLALDCQPSRILPGDRLDGIYTIAQYERGAA